MSDLTDFEWRVIEPQLPNKPGGVRALIIVATVQLAFNTAVAARL